MLDQACGRFEGMGETGGWLGIRVLALALALLLVVHRYYFSDAATNALQGLSSDTIATADVSAAADPVAVGEGGGGDGDAAFALFTHENNQLHCMERELRHPCVRELRNFLDDKSNEENRRTALTCVGEVLESSNDYWELKNMTHLLLDLDVNEHAFDTESRDNEFVLTGIAFAEKLIKHEECLSDFDTKGELECRCPLLFGKIALLKYKNAKMLDAGQELFKSLKGMSWNGEVNSYAAGEAFPWDEFQHTPQTWVPGLRSMTVWPRELWHDLPICKRLEDNFEVLREETEKALRNPDDNGFEEAYRFLYEQGEWNRVLLYHDKEFTPECETVFPRFCALLKQWLPSKPGLPWTSNQNEQVMVIKMKKGTDVELHSGPSNNILNIHIGISGLKGAQLIVANETYEWEEGKVIAWDGSYDHSVNCLHCEKERVIMMVRYMHPDMAPEHYRGHKRTHYEDIPKELQG